MKRYFSHMVTALLAGACLAATSCSKSDEGPKIPEPNFPAAVSQTVEAGGTYTFNIEPNQDWEVSVPTATYQWFWIQDGSQKVSSKVGSAGKAEITIGVSEQEEFDENRVCEVTLKMGGQSKVILTLTRGTLERSLSVRTCVLDEEGNFSYDPDSDTSGLSYLYHTDPATSIDLVWPDGNVGFMMPILVEANFNWAINRLPDWVTSRITVGNAGEQVELLLIGNAPAYPLDGDNDGKLLIIDSDNHDKSFEVGITIPPCRDVFKISDFETVSKFNAKSEYYNSKTSSWVPGNAMGNIMGIDGSKIYVFSEITQEFGESYLSGDAEDIAWITVTEEPWDSSADGGVVQTRRVEIGVAANTGDARKGVVVALPASEAAKITSPDDLIDQDVREQYKQYIVTTIEQQPDPGAIEAVSPEGMAEVFAEFKKLSKMEWPMQGAWANIPDGYKLTYTKDYSWEESYLTFNRAYTDYTVYGFDGPYDTPLDKENCWITVEKSSKGVIVKMDPSKNTNPGGEGENEASIVFSDAAGNFAVIYCVYDPDAPIGGGDEGFEVKFASANVSGATLEAITKENYQQIAAQYGFDEKDLNESLGMNIVLYALVYTKSNPTDAILDVKTNQRIMLMPYEGVDWLDYEPVSTNQLLIKMEKPGSGQAATGMVQFYDSSYNKIECIIYCKPSF